MVKSKLCLDIEKMGDPDRAHRYFAKNPSFALIRKKFAGIKILHRLPPPSAPEQVFIYYSYTLSGITGHCNAGRN